MSISPDLFKLYLPRARVPPCAEIKLHVGRVRSSSHKGITNVINHQTNKHHSLPNASLAAETVSQAPNWNSLPAACARSDKEKES